jgi:NTP pyrophosphatase (non-canonical NTP hydrolase)
LIGPAGPLIRASIRQDTGQSTTTKLGWAYFAKRPQACSVAGLAGEAGEVAELLGTRASWLQRAAARVVDTLKKFIWHGRPFDRDKLVKELGDTYWYLADLARQNGIPMSEVQATNVEKLMARFPRGHFTIEDANARADER